MSKSSIFKFNQYNQRELSTARAIAHAHIFSKDSFINLGTKTMFYKYLKENIIKPVDGKDGYYEITPKFINAYQTQIDADYRTASSGSIVHSSGIMQVVSSIIPSAARIESEGVLKEELREYQKTTDYMRKEAQLRAEYKERMEQIRNELKVSATPIERHEAMTAFNLCNKFYSGSENMCSVPDMRITVDREQINELINNISSMEHSTEREEAYARHAIRTLREIQETTTTEQVQIYFEITTSNYGSVEIQQKEHTSQITDTRIIYFAATEE